MKSSSSSIVLGARLAVDFVCAAMAGLGPCAASRIVTRVTNKGDGRYDAATDVHVLSRVADLENLFWKSLREARCGDSGY